MNKITNATFLQNLFSAISNDFGTPHDTVNSKLDRYSLYLIVLADPTNSSIFFKSFNSRFKNYQRIAGKKLLLIAPFQEAAWYHNLNKKKWYSNFFSKSRKRSVPVFNELCESRLAIQAFCILLGICYDDMPALLITDNIRSDSWYLTPTSTNQFYNQLENLKKDVIKNNASRSLADFKSSAFDDIQKLEPSVNPIKIIYKILDLIRNENSENLSFEKINEVFSEVIIQKDELSLYEVYGILLTLLKENDLNRQRIHNAKFGDKLSKGLPKMTAMDKMIPLNVPHLLKYQWKNIEPSTINNLYTSGYILDHMSNFMRESRDFRIYALPLCVSFENEINLSVVQLIRKHLGVQMPDYFDKYCPTMTKLPIIPSIEIVPNPREIYFNNMGRKKWLPPGLGESRLGFKTLKMNSKDFGSDWLTEELTILFLKMWKNIQEIRNLVAHPGELNEKEKEQLEKSLVELHKSGLLNAITELKERLRHLSN